MYKVFTQSEPLRGFTLDMGAICSNFLWGGKSTNVSELYWGEVQLYVCYHTYDDS